MSAHQEPKQSSTFTVHRPKSSLLIPSTRPLSRPRPSESLSPKHAVPTLPIRSVAPTEESTNREREKEKRRIEVDFSAAPQPFLDPEIWEKIRDRTEWSA
ncbi:hypothetical protein BDW67DRAFT_155437 [Aspergillus spinulosporus]